MELLNYRQYLLEQLLAQYQQYDTAPEKDTRLINAGINKLLGDLKQIDRNLNKYSREYTLHHREKSPEKSEQLLSNYRYLYGSSANTPFKTDTVSSLVGKIGFESAKADLNSHHQKYANAQKQLLKAYNKVQPFVEQSLALSPMNPFQYVLGFMLETLISRRHYVVTDLIDTSEQQLEKFLASGTQHISLSCPIPLFAHDDILEQWLAHEEKQLTKRWHSERSSQQVKTAIANRFYQKEWLSFWALLKKHAPTLDLYESTNDYLQDERDQQKTLSQNPYAHFAQHYKPSNESANTLKVPHTAVRPRFTDEQGNPYANTQVLCWRYNPKWPDKLARMDIDRDMSRLYTVGIMYTDADGYATIQKPDFLQNPKHSFSLQVEEDTGNVLLLERTKESPPENLKVEDPLTGVWHSYQGEDNLVHQSQTIAAVSDNKELTAQNWLKAPLEKLGLNTPGRLTHDLTVNDASWFFELPVGYDFGFMVLPLGYGSLSIKALHTLPAMQNCNAIQVCTRETITKENPDIKLPKTLRQTTHELVQCRETLDQTQNQLMTTNQHKLVDIHQLEQLKTWVTNTEHHPFEKDSPTNKIEKRELHTQLGQLQAAIQKTIQDPVLIEGFKNSREPIEANTYTRQYACRHAADAYDLAIKKAFAILDDPDIPKRLHAWRKQQENIDEGEQNALAEWLDSNTAFLLKGFGDTSTPPSFRIGYVKELTEGITAPYTPYIYDAFAGVIAQLSVSREGERLYNHYLLPLLQYWIEDKQVSEIIKLAEAEAGKSENPQYVDVALKANFSRTETAGQNTNLKDIIGTTEDVFKTIFIRGPGAPSLMQAVLDLAGHRVQTRYQTTIHVQTQLSIRLYSVQAMLSMRLSSKKTYNSMGKFIYRAFAGSNSKRMRQILSEKNMSSWVYGSANPFEGTNRRSKFEAIVKTSLFLYDSVLSKLLFMNHMDEDKWAPGKEPTADDYRSAAYRYAVSVQSTANSAVSLLAMPKMMQYWIRHFGKDSTRIGKLLEKEITRSTSRASSLIFGSQGAKNVVNTGMVWANRLCVVTTAIALVQSVDDTRRSLKYGEETEILTNALLAVSSAATLAGLILPSIAFLNVAPGVGQVLSIAGAVISLSVIAVSAAWESFGRSYFMGDTFVQFDNNWAAFKQDAHYLEYADENFGATAELINLCTGIEDQHEKTLIDEFKNANIIITSTGPQSPVLTLLILRLNSMGYLKKDEDVSWQEMSFTSIPSLLMQHQIEEDVIRDCIDLNYDEKQGIYEINGLDQPEEWNAATEQTAKYWWARWFINFKEFADENPESPVVKLVWNNLINEGKFPGQTDSTEGYTIAELAKLDFPVKGYQAMADENKVNMRRQMTTFLRLWQKRSKAIHEETQ